MQKKNRKLQGWKEVELRELFELKYGSSLPKNKREEGKIKVYGSNGIVGFHKEGITKGQTIIVGRKGSIGKINLSKNSCFPIDTTYYIDETKIPCDLNWIFYIFKTLKLENLNRAAAVPGLNRNDVYSIKIPLPPIQTQKKIVAILEKAEQLKQQREQADKLTDKYLKSVFNEMFLNKDFEEIEIGKIAKLTMGGTPLTTKKEYWENGEINWMKSGNIKGDFIFSIPNKITKLGFKKSNTTLYPKDTVVIALNGQGKTRGTTAILKVETTSNQSVVGIMINKNKILSEYLHYNLKIRYDELRNITGDNSRSGLNLTILRNLKIPLPPPSLQKKFSSIVEKVEKLKEKQKQSSKEINDLFNVLMQKAFKGELGKC